MTTYPERKTAVQLLPPPAKFVHHMEDKASRFMVGGGRGGGGEVFL
jgi:hypothetical protein